MSVAFLNLRRLLGDTSRIPSGLDFVDLDVSASPTRLILSTSLARAALTAPNTRVYDLVSHWRSVSGVACLPALERVFTETPFFLEGVEHKVRRGALAPTYRRLASSVTDWLPETVGRFWANCDPNKSAIDVASSFTSLYFESLLANYCGQNATFDLSSMFGANLFSMMPRRSRLETREAFTRELIDALTLALEKTGRKEEAMPLLSVIFMGHEPLYASLVYGLSHGLSEFDDAADLYARSSPVYLLGRTFLRDQTLGGAKFAAGQSIFISPAICRELAPASRSFSFGVGRHVCPGRHLALAALNAFIKGAPEDVARFSEENYRFVRDLVLIPRILECPVDSSNG